jgi:hypothetical protein
LDPDKCKAVWSLTEREGDTLSQDKAAPFIVNFTMVDTNKDGKVSQDEFTDGCSKGLVQEQASKPAESGGGQTPEQPSSAFSDSGGNFGTVYRCRYRNAATPLSSLCSSVVGTVSHWNDKGLIPVVMK